MAGPGLSGRGAAGNPPARDRDRDGGRERGWRRPPPAASSAPLRSAPRPAPPPRHRGAATLGAGLASTGPPRPGPARCEVRGRDATGTTLPRCPPPTQRRPHSGVTYLSPRAGTGVPTVPPSLLQYRSVALLAITRRPQSPRRDFCPPRHTLLPSLPPAPRSGWHRAAIPAQGSQGQTGHVPLSLCLPGRRTSPHFSRQVIEGRMLRRCWHRD